MASQDLGDYRGELRKLANGVRRALIISNALDYCGNEGKIDETVEKNLTDLNDIRIEGERLDLRKFFGRRSELERYVEVYGAEIIFAVGGDVYCLATAMRKSGMDEIVRELTVSDKVVYGGYSAGAMVAADDLLLYSVGDRINPERAREVYAEEPCVRGLGLIREYVVPHANRANYIRETAVRLENIEKAGGRAIILNDADVYSVSGKERRILRGSKVHRGVV